MEHNELEEDYFLIHLEGLGNNLLAIQEKKQLEEEQYHSISREESGTYSILVDIEKRTGRNIYSLGVHEECYHTYQFESVSFQKINDFAFDGFEYDKERKVVFYGYIYGLYAVKSGDDYYDVITGQKIPWGVIHTVSERETKDDFETMIEDLEFIQGHKDIYLKFIEEVLRLLQEGANNREAAVARYRKNYHEKKQQEDFKLKQQLENGKRLREERRIENAPKREKVKELIDGIRNSD